MRIVEALRFTERDTGLDGQQLADDFGLLAGRARVLPAVRQQPDARRRPSFTATKCPAGNTRTCISRRGPWAWPIAGRKSAGRMPRPTSCSATSSRSRRRSKAVGDMALFMVANELTAAGHRRAAIANWRFPNRSSTCCRGMMGQPPGGWPPGLQKRILARPPAGQRAAPARACRRPISTQAIERSRKLIGREPNRRDALSYLLYPKVYQEFAAHANDVFRYQRAADAGLLLSARRSARKSRSKSRKARR